MNKQQLANKIWESANKMRSKIEANEYKDYILGFIFYKYLSEQELKFCKEQEMTDDEIVAMNEDDEETAEWIKQEIGYFIPYKNLFSTWINEQKSFDISNVRDALNAFDDRLIYKAHEKVFKGIFNTLQTGLSNLGSTSAEQTKAVSSLIHLIDDIPMGKKQDYDILGFIYEYLISMFAANAGKKAGEFYTPHEVSLLMSEIIAHHLKTRKEIKIYDPTSGSGSLLINIGNSIAKYIDNKDAIKYYAQELKKNTYNLTRMNLVMRDIKSANIEVRNGDTLADDWPYFDESNPAETYDSLYVDAVVSNPPYSQNWEPDNKEHDPRYAEFGLAPKSKADYAFLLHDLFHLKPDGIMAIVLPHGVLFRGGEEGEIRKNLIEKNHIDAIIGLPANIFFGTGIPTIIMILKKQRDTQDVLFIDASKGFTKEGKNNKLRACDIKKIVDTIIERKTVDKYAKVVTRDEIRDNDYNLNIPRYIDSFDKAVSYDIYATMFGGLPFGEIDELQEFWQAFPQLKKDLFIQQKDIPYANLNINFANEDENIKSVIQNHSDIIAFEDNFKTAFSDFKDYLKNELIVNVENLSIATEEDRISENIFARLNDIPLVDKYTAYQFLDDEWTKIANDIEILQIEGINAAKITGEGAIFDFELVQKNMLFTEYTALKDKEERLSQIPSEYEEIIDSLSEEQKESEALNDKGDKFAKSGLTKVIKDLKSDTSEEAVEFREKLQRASNLMKEESTLRKEIKTKTAELKSLTEKTIHKLTDEQINFLLEKKWIDSLIANLNKLPDTIIDELVKKVQDLYDKYKTTYLDTEAEIAETEKELAAMIDELDGNEFDMKGLNEFKSLLMGDK